MLATCNAAGRSVHFRNQEDASDWSTSTEEFGQPEFVTTASCSLLPPSETNETFVSMGVPQETASRLVEIGRQLADNGEEWSAFVTKIVSSVGKHEVSSVAASLEKFMTLAIGAVEDKPRRLRSKIDSDLGRQGTLERIFQMRTRRRQRQALACEIYALRNGTQPETLVDTPAHFKTWSVMPGFNKTPSASHSPAEAMSVSEDEPTSESVAEDEEEMATEPSALQRQKTPAGYWKNLARSVKAAKNRRRPRFFVTLETRTGAKTRISLADGAETTVAAVKRKFSEKEGFACDKLRLVMNNPFRELENDRTLSSYQMKSGDVLLVRLSLGW